MNPKGGGGRSVGGGILGPGKVGWFGETGENKGDRNAAFWGVDKLHQKPPNNRGEKTYDSMENASSRKGGNLSMRRAEGYNASLAAGRRPKKWETRDLRRKYDGILEVLERGI